MRLLIILILLLTSCATKLPDKMLLKQTSFDHLNRWHNDNQLEAFQIFKKSCMSFKYKGKMQFQQIHFNKVCNKAQTIEVASQEEARVFFEQNFVPYKIYNNYTDKGLFTGYYEPKLHGSYTKTVEHVYPLYKKPPVHLTQYSHREINRGALDNQNLEFLYVTDHVERFFLHIQGSGRVILPDGKMIRVGYAGNNSYSYTPIGSVMIELDLIDQDNMSASTIKNWLYNNPQHASRIMEQNHSYVFFDIVDGDGPIGAQGLVLTPERSLAVDMRFIPLGIPLWLETDIPITKGTQPYHHLMVSQDVGGAIKGPIRGDIFFGHGKKAEFLAHHMQNSGSLYILLPRNLPQYVINNNKFIDDINL